ncbi:RNA 2',3'-cyclic phosphodiesterase [Adhaeretor mobilis]|uniref:RNA 2',3'-cyclic phosphodiesterase n=1 Tax=Adhaeretor mobilis TaxID=1930276 RepID=A0A517MY75_9BACT|nr:RNA 2',3'-cyclic phosphodiesterase [Adhaeretor mobilis]QDS99839.1 2',5' RNA ligase family [Adhaeretor mobilis]
MKSYQMPKTRTFIAVPAEGEVQGAALNAIDQLRSVVDGVKWVEPENLHWTLQFLGDIDDVEMAQACRRVVKVVAQHEPFVLHGKGISAFPSPDRPKTLYLASDVGSKKFCALQADIEESLDDMGFRGERRQFVPHLTLGRINRGGRGGDALSEQLVAMKDLEAGAMAVDEVLVFASRLHRQGPGYQVLATAALGN